MLNQKHFRYKQTSHQLQFDCVLCDLKAEARGGRLVIWFVITLENHLNITRKQR